MSWLQVCSGREARNLRVEGAESVLNGERKWSQERILERFLSESTDPSCANVLQSSVEVRVVGDHFRDPLADVGVSGFGRGSVPGLFGGEGREGARKVRVLVYEVLQRWWDCTILEKGQRGSDGGEQPDLQCAFLIPSPFLTNDSRCPDLRCSLCAQCERLEAG